MKTVIEILSKVKRESKEGKEYTLTTVLLNDGMEVDTVQEIEVGDQVQIWYDDEWNKTKLKKV